jgi:hypothetical protein
VADTPPDINAKQYVVSALGGTQTGVTVHSVNSPFTLTMFRPKQYKQLGVPNPSTGVIARIPRNSFKIICRKGMLPLAGQAVDTAIYTLTIDNPAGTDLASPQEIRAALSALFGLASQQSAGIGDTLVSGVL